MKNQKIKIRKKVGTSLPIRKGMKLEKLQKIIEKHKQLVLEIRKNIRANNEKK
jgi:hypothetical protein